MFIILILCIVTMFVFVAQIVAIFTADAPFVPVPSKIVEKIVESLKLNDESILYDLGCGDAKVLRKALDMNPGIRAVGVEVAFFPYFLAKFKSRKYKNLQIYREDIFKTDIRDATHIFIYLFPHIVEKLMPILEKKCRKGTRVVSCDFQDKNRLAEEVILLENNNEDRGTHLFIYIV